MNIGFCLWNLVFDSAILNMTRGNQREKAREKAAKKQKEVEKKRDSSKKGGNAGKTLEERRERDAAIMRDKQLKKEDAAGATGGASK